MFDGLEIDMLSLGDADCILVTQWANSRGWAPQRVLIDGGKAEDFDVVRDFLSRKRVAELWAAVCTHPHEDHAAGLIRLVRDRSLLIRTGWMHDVRNHFTLPTLRRACLSSSSQADAVRQVLETTEELASAFLARGIRPREPFAGNGIAVLPNMVVLGPSQEFYRRTVRAFAGIEMFPAPPTHFAPLAACGTDGNLAALSRLLGGTSGLDRGLTLGTPSGLGSLDSFFGGALSKSSVKENPTTQPFNDTSAILGIDFSGQRLLFTADAGADALDRVPGDWKNLQWMQVPHHGSPGNLSRDNIERFCPKVAYVSASGDNKHPSRAIVNGLIKVNAGVFSTHWPSPGHLWYWIGTVPARRDYGPALALKGQSDPVIPSLPGLLSAMR